MKLRESKYHSCKGEARERIAKAVAAEIARLIHLGRSNIALIGKRPLKEGDIAVLVRRNAEARLMQKALSGLNIPSVLFSMENLFDSHEALEMERILSGISDPNDERLIRAALATDIMGVKGEELDSLKVDERGWEVWLLKFGDYHDLWNDQGFIRMFRSFILREQVLPRLMSLPDGERRNTNVLHLAEVLHQQSLKRKLGMAGLLKWLSDQIDEDTRETEEHQLRLESDENAVKLVTVHKSKGLEYPVVFCPFSWDGSKITKRKDPFTFHDKGDHMRLTLDLGSTEVERNRIHAEKELLAENLRLLYVALTRARNRCTLVWGRFNEAETSAPAFLFHQPPSWEPDDVVNATGRRVLELSDEEGRSELDKLLQKAGGTIKLSDLLEASGEEYLPSHERPEALIFRKFTGHIDRDWKISSFSALISGRLQSAELADRDAIVLLDRYDQEASEETIVEEGPPGIFSFPRGAKAGICLHDIFEHLEFTQKDPSEMKKLVSGKLKETGFDLEWEKTLLDMIQKVLAAPLEPECKDLHLSCIQNKDRINELGFYFPLKPITPEKLRDLFVSHTDYGVFEDFPEQIERLAFSPVRGFMKGYIDMVFQFDGRFYLVDWKSNFLGNSLDDYRQEALALAMKEGFYILQYRLYTVALDQYLRLRLHDYNYETHFGGVYYIFLRGVDPDRNADCGIFRDKPSAALINALRENLLDSADP